MLQKSHWNGLCCRWTELIWRLSLSFCLKLFSQNWQGKYLWSLWTPWTWTRSRSARFVSYGHRLHWCDFSTGHFRFTLGNGKAENCFERYKSVTTYIIARTNILPSRLISKVGSMKLLIISQAFWEFCSGCGIGCITAGAVTIVCSLSIWALIFPSGTWLEQRGQIGLGSLCWSAQCSFKASGLV